MSNSSLKPIVLHSHGTTPNPQKVLIILEELAIPYVIKEVAATGLKTPPYTDINPNGRVPAIEDPNTGINLWESGAIVQYLVETYDKSSTLTYTTTPEKYQLNQWLIFQVSGQGPYFGQATWFKYFHAEKIPSAVERYMGEIERVIGVLDGWLQQHEFLVGDKITYADLAFVPWCSVAAVKLNSDKTIDMSKYPGYSKWLAGMLARESVKKIIG